MADIKAAYDMFPVGEPDVFCDAMLAMRSKLLTLTRELDKQDG